MIVGTVQQEAECSWQDVCDSWMTQDEEAEAGVHQVGVDQGTSELADKGQCKKARDVRNDEEPPEVGDLLVEGEEQEYFLKLLMRRVSPERPKENPSPKGEANSSKGRKSKSEGRKTRRKKLSRGATNEAPKSEKAADPVGGGERQVASNLAHKPEAKGRGLAEEDRQKKDQVTRLPPTSGGECSVQKKPECS
jgi:hypothetical protein